MGLFDSIKKFVDNIFGAIGDVLGYVLGIDTDLEDKYKGQLINKSSNIQKIPVIYGERLVGGTRVFVSTGGGKKNQYLYIALVLSEGEVDSIGDIYINDIISTDSRFTNKATIYKYRGTDNQAATTLFADADESWTSAHQLKGVAYLAMRFKYDQDVFTSIPEIRAVVKGKKVYNPATQITEWSDNPALCLRDYLTNPRYGKGLPASAIDDASIIQAASDCDSLVTPYGGATDIPLFKFNAIIDTGETVFDNVKKIIASMRGILPYSNGKYSLLVDKDQSSTFTLTEDNILSDIKIVSSSKENKFNQVTAKFPNPAKRWELDTVTYPDSGSTEETAFLNEDNQQILSKEITLHNVTNAYRAKDLARIACLASRRQSLTVSVTCTSEALNIAVGDIVTIEHDSLGWTGTAVQEFRVMGMVLDDSGEVDLTLQQYDASIYPWVEQSEIPDNPETTLPDPFTTAPVTNQSGTGQAVVQNDGTVVYFYDLEWDEPDDALVEYYLIDVNKTIDEVETLAAETLQTQNLSFRYMVSDTSIDYGFTIRAVNGAGTRSAGVTIPASSVIKDTTPPSVIDAQTTSVVAGLQSITVSWENPTEEDFDLVRIKVNDTNTEPTSHFAATRSDTFIHDIGEYSTIKYYWIAPVDTSGNVADYTFAGSATTGSITIDDVPQVASTFYIELGDNDAPTDTEFNTAVGRNPIENDFVIVNKEFAFVYDGSVWTAVTEFIDGSLLVSGSISADDITTGTLNANDVTISNLTVTSGQLPSDLVYDADISDVVRDADITSFIEAGDVNANVSSISGGVIQAGTAITVGTGDNVAVLSGSDATYRLWAGDATSADAPFKVSQTGVLYATGAEISGNITAGSIDAENITFTGSLIADGLSTIPNVEALNMTQSLRNAIEEIIVTKFGSDASTGYYDEATGSFDAQDDNTEICRINTFQHNGSDIDIDVTFSRSWQASSNDIPSVTVNIQRSVAGANSWTTIKTQTITGSVFYEPELNNYFANIQGVVSITDNPTTGNYDYRFFAGTISNLSLITISAKLEANEQGEQIGTIDLADYARIDQDETISGNYTFSGTTSGIDYGDLDNTPTLNTANWDTAYTYSQVGHLPLTGGTISGTVSLVSTNDAQLYLNGNDSTWAGIAWTDSGGTDYTWYRGENSTFSIGGGGSNVSGKKLHINGGTTIGSSYSGTAVPTNGLYVEGDIKANSNLHQFNNSTDAHLGLFSANGARQRADSRNESTFARTHWYGVSDTGGTSNFRHAWYDGNSYVDVTAENDGVTFGGHLTSTGNMNVTGDLKMIGTDSYIWTPNTSAGFTGLWDAYNSRSVWRYDNDLDSIYLQRFVNIGNVASTNTGSWNARLNLTGANHARLDVFNDADDIRVSMYSHVGNGNGRVGTISNHPLGLMANGVVHADLTTSGQLNTSSGYQVGGAQIFDSARNLYATRPIFDSESTSDDALVSRWRYSDSNAYMLEIHQRVTSGVVRWSFGQVNNSTTYSDLFVLDRGRIGLGIQNPEKQFHVYGAGNEPMYLQGTGGGVWMNIKSSTSDLWSMGADTNGWAIYNRTSSKYTLRSKSNGVLDIPAVSSGTLISSGISSDTMGYNPSYGVYIGGAGSKYLYSGNSATDHPTYWSGTAYEVWTTKAYQASNSGGASKILETASSGYLMLYNWINVGSSGLYSSTNGAHWYPNTASYGAWRINGSRNSYTGIWLDYSNVNVGMYDSSGNGGDYSTSATGGWHYYYHRGNSCMGIGGSTTSSSYGLYEQRGGIYSTGNIVAYSDARVKENVQTINNALNTVNLLRGVTYNKIDDPEKKKVIGFIAQEVNSVEDAKPLVTYAEDIDQYGVSYGNATALLVEAIKELSGQVNELKQEIEVLKNGNN